MRRRFLRPISDTVAQNATGLLVPQGQKAAGGRAQRRRSNSDDAQTAATHCAGNERSQARSAVVEDTSAEKVEVAMSMTQSGWSQSVTS